MTKTSHYVPNGTGRDLYISRDPQTVAGTQGLRYWGKTRKIEVPNKGTTRVRLEKDSLNPLHFHNMEASFRMRVRTVPTGVADSDAGEHFATMYNRGFTETRRLEESQARERKLPMLQTAWSATPVPLLPERLSEG